MSKYTSEEIRDNRQGLRDRKKGTLALVQIDTLAQHPGTQAYYDGREGIDYSEEFGDDEEDGGEG